MASRRYMQQFSRILSRESSLARSRWARKYKWPSCQPRWVEARWQSGLPAVSLSRSIAAAIEQAGPISLMHYMKQCLTGKDGGYYTTSLDPFGEKGDFVTSPEISQMFGEMIGIWIVAEWLAQDRCNGKKVKLIELGPGRGTLMDDILRTIRKFPLSREIAEIQLLEASSTLRDLQCARLCGEGVKPEWKEGTWSGTSKYFDAPITWYEDIRQISTETDAAPFFIAHEFFDALPILAFQNTPEGWRELLVDIKRQQASLILTTGELAAREPEFCLTLSPRQSPFSRLLNSLSTRYESLSEIPNAVVEVSPESAQCVMHMSKAISTASSGAALIIDYGPGSTVPVNTLKGIQRHKRVSPFTQAGLVDISADVDFGALAETALKDPNVEVHGPVEQGHFLFGLGIRERFNMLVSSTSDQQQLAILRSGYERLTEAGGLGMGKVYKAMAIVPEANGRPLAGFDSGSASED